MKSKMILLIMSALLLRTNAATQVWTQIDTEFPGNYHTIVWAGLDTAYLGHLSQLVKTIDGGQTWKRYQYTTISPEGIRTINFPSALIGYAGGNHVYKTTDGGVTWDSIFTATSLSKPLQLRASWFINDLIGFEFGDARRKTTDGGINWEGTYTETSIVEATQFINDRIGFAGGWTNTALGITGGIDKTTDSGVSWKGLYFGKAFHKFEIHALSFVNELFGWIGGVRYYSAASYRDVRAMYTIDGGETWDTVSQVFPHTVNCIEFIDERVGFIGDVEGWIFSTTDGGASWLIDSTSTQGRSVNDFCVVDKSVIYAAGNGGLLLKKVLTTSVDESTPKTDIQVYPNPTFGTCTVVVGEFTSHSRPSCVIIRDLNGREVMREVAERTVFTFDLSPLPPGLYIVNATTNSVVQCANVMVR